MSEIKYYGEAGSDKYIRETFFPDFSYKGTMIEIGAGPPEFLSMSKHFRDNGWRCICIEPNLKFVEQHRALGNEIHHCACSFENKNEETFNITTTSQWSEENTGISCSALKIRLSGGGNLIKTEEIRIRVRTLNSLLEELKIEKIDFISIDVEGWEIEVMKGFDTTKYKPKVIQLENGKLYDEYMKSIEYEKCRSEGGNTVYTPVKI